MDQRLIDELIKKYTEGTASEAERELLTRWYRDIAYQDGEFPEDEGETYDDMFDRLNEATKPKSKLNAFRNWSIAASVVFVFGVGLTLYIKKSKPVQPAVAKLISPGGNKAILTLANGTKISLTDAGNGNVANQNGVQISKTASGQLVYHFTSTGGQSSNLPADNNGAVSYNTIETPVGGQYQVELPDGSRVWLNSVTSIRFPVSFAGNAQRVVELKGEAYFEVKHSNTQAFKVLSGSQEVEDLGTEFNIKAYADETVIKTTLVKGAAKVTAAGAAAVLKPGEQAAYSNALTVANANIDEAIAWKNGYFTFEDESLDEIMKVVSRWYNIHYVFEDQSLRNEKYGAITTRFTDISPLLNMMQQTGNASFKVQGNTVIISAKKN